MNQHSLPHTLSRIGLHVVLLSVGAIFMLPFIWSVATSLKPLADLFQVTPRLIPSEVRWENYSDVFNTVPFERFYLNTIFVTLMRTIGQVFFASLAAFAFSQLRFPGRDVLFFMLLSGLMVPDQVLIIPRYIMMRELDWLDTYQGLIVPILFSAFGTFLLRQFFLTIPRDLEDAAKLDGAGHLRILWNVIVPLSAPALAALAIFIALAAWNEFFWPNIFLTSPEKMTLPVGLVMISGRFGSGSPVVILAALTMIVVPLLILFAFAQRRITESLAMTGLRG